MIAPVLQRSLEPVIARQRSLRQFRNWAAIWVAAAVVTGLILLASSITGWWWNGLPFAIGTIALVAALIGSIRAHRWHPNYVELARRIEQHHPEVRDLLRTAVEQRSEDGSLSYLQRRVIAEAIQSAKDKAWIDTVSTSSLVTAQLLHWGALAGLILFLFQLPKEMTPVGPVAKVDRRAEVEVTPGDASIERGTGLAILARFQGPLPSQVTLSVTPDAAESKVVTLAKSLDDPIFGATLPEIQADTTYRVQYDGSHTRDFKIRVFDYPRLERADAQLQYPDYTQLTPKRIEDTRRVGAVEGTQVSYEMQLNKPVAQARLVSRDHPNIELATETNRASLTLSNYVVTDNVTYELQLIDGEGRTNKVPAQFVFQALKNRAPELKLALPRGDQRVSPIQEVNFQFEASDDFGLSAAGLTIRVGEADPQTVTLSGPLKANEKTNLNFQLKLEDYAVKVDDLVSYYVWAEDVGPDGQARRTAGDMFFAEIRPFEEIFREDESQQSPQQQAGQGQQSEQTEKLLELQKQILTATWNLHRNPPTATYKDDVKVVLESQERALEQAAELQEMAKTEEASRLVGAVESAMKGAIKELQEAVEKPPALADAQLQEQNAYQALLKFQAHEYRVTQSQGQSAQSRSGRNRQQLNQLELRQSENRYETESQAQQSPARQEQLQVLNRLRDLARRQQDINERVKELQTALEEAKTEAQREEIRRRLQRLREDQKQMLEDIDELRERMSQSENQSQMAEARQQLEQSRSQAQQAAESLDEGKPQEALSAGTRAARDLEKLRDDFRQKNSNQFAEDMRQMRQEARDLASSQDNIARSLENVAQDEHKTLTDTPERTQLLTDLKKQEQGLTNLLDHMTAVTQQAEAAEPLLARQLYDTVRKTHQGNLDDSLRLTRELVENSFLNQARPFEQQARRDIQDLRRSVETAAQSILGDDTESLRLARNELEALSQQIQNEVRKATGGSGTNETQGMAGAGRGSNDLAQASAAAGSETNRQAAASQSGQEGQARQSASQGAEGQNAQQLASGGTPSEQNTRSPNAQGEGQQGESQQQGKQQSSRPGDGNQQSQTAQARPGQGQRGENGENQRSPGQQGQGQGQGQPGPDQQNQAAQNSGERPGQGQRPGEGQRPGQEGGQSGQGQSQLAEQQGQPGENGQPGTPQNSPGQRPGGSNRQQAGQGNRFFDQRGPEGNDGGGSGPSSGPLTGEEYRNWSDRMRNVEEMLQEPELRSQVATVRERVREMRAEFKRHAQEPQWDLVGVEVIAPMVELQNRIQEELARRQSQEALVPIDRDPVPRAFTDLVRRYYERLGQGD